MTYPKRSGRSSRRENVDTEIGITLAVAYAALGILAFIILAIWHAAGQPGQVASAAFSRHLLLIMYVLGLLMATWANIWLLVIAFRDKIEQGLLCLLVPCYAIYYIFSRWRETRGIFAMCVAPCVVLISFAIFGGLVLGVAGPLAFMNGVRDRLEAIAPDFTPRADAARVAAAEQVFREYINAINRLTDELSRLQPVAPGMGNRAMLQMQLGSLQQSAMQVQHVENRAKAAKVTKADMTELKKSVGADMRAAIIALKYQITRLASFPGFAAAFPTVVADLDRMLAVWEAPTDGSTDNQLADLFPTFDYAPEPSRPSGAAAGWRGTARLSPRCNPVDRPASRRSRPITSGCAASMAIAPSWWCSRVCRQIPTRLAV